MSSSASDQNTTLVVDRKKQRVLGISRREEVRGCEPSNSAAPGLPHPHGSWCQSKIWQPAGAPGALCATTPPSPTCSPTPSPPLHSLRAGPATCQLTSEQEAVPWRMSAVPLSILGLLLIGEKKEIKFCSDEVLGLGGGGGCSRSTVLTVQRKGRGEEEGGGGGGGLPGRKHRDC